MIGRNQLQFTAAQFEAGMSSSDYSDDGALGISSYGLNPFVVPGAMYSLASPTDISTNVVDNIIATCSDHQSTGSNNRYLVGSAGNLYSFNGTTITKQYTDSTATYHVGKTDIAPFNGYFFVSSTAYLGQWNGGGTYTYNYKSFNDGTAPHPLLNYINSLYAGDGNLLVALNTGGTLSTILTLPSGEIIMALGIDPMTGLMMISTQHGYDMSDTLTSPKYVYLYDGVSGEYTRKIPVDDLVTSFTSFQGQVICGIGFNIGVWTGTGISYLRLLRNASVNNGENDLPYKHHVAVIGRQLHVIDGPVVLTMGPVVAGKTAFFYTAYEQTSNPPTYHLTCIFNRGALNGNALGIAYYNTSATTYKVYTFDFGSTAAGQGVMYSNKIYFPRPVFIHRQRIFTTGITTTSGAGNAAFLDDNGVVQAVAGTGQDFVVPSEGAPSTNSPQYYFDFDYGGYKTQTYQPRISFSSQGFGITRIITYYDPAE